jgi:hypothetical protein
VLLLAVALAALWCFRFRGWYPHDDGTLGQAAERILRGQIPHRDFVNPYTGGVALLHALIFRFAGISTNALRDALALLATLWCAGLFWLVRQWLSLVGAAIVIALIAVWSVPMYPVPMPSWYVLFLTTTAGIVLAAVHDRKSVFVLAGFLIGLAALAKITALLALAGAGWGIVAVRQVDGDRRTGAPEVVIAALLFDVLVLHLIQPLFSDRVLVHVAGPALLVVTAIGVREARQIMVGGAHVDGVLWRRLFLLLAGAVVPACCFAGWLASHGALAPFIASVRGVVGQRAASAAMTPPSMQSVVYAVPIVGILAASASRWPVRGWIVAVAAIVIAVVASRDGIAYQEVWHALRGLPTIAALLFAAAWVSGATPVPGGARSALLIFAPIAAVMCLTEFPFAAPIYFLYVFPVIAIALAAAVGLQPPARRPAAGALALVFLGFGFVVVLPGAPASLDAFGERNQPMAWLQLPRARLLVPADEAARYQQLFGVLEALPPGPIWAGPDAPEIAFLAGRQDLNPAFFSFLSSAPAPGGGFAASQASAGAVAVVVDSAPSFSLKLSPAVRDSVRRYFPVMTTIDQFVVHARASTP